MKKFEEMSKAEMEAEIASSGVTSNTATSLNRTTRSSLKIPATDAGFMPRTRTVTPWRAKLWPTMRCRS